MFKLFKNKNDSQNNSLMLKTASLLIHAAKIDENYTDSERAIIKETILNLGTDSSEIEKLMFEAENEEKNSNQILDFTKEIKNADRLFKVSIIDVFVKLIH